MGDQVVTVDEILRRQRGSILRGRSGRSTVLTGEPAQRFYERVSRVYGVGRSAIPVGTPISLADVEQPTITSIPSLVTRPVRVTTGQVPVVPVSSGRQPAAPDQAVVPTQPIKKETTMDLGSILNQLTGSYVQIQQARAIMRGARAQQQLVSTDDVYGRDLPSVGMGMGLSRNVLFPAAIPGLGGSVGKIAMSIAAALGVTEITDEILQAAAAASRVKCRRKRRRLATHSDIKDLAALKAVLGSGKAFDTWIATRKM